MVCLTNAVINKLVNMVSKDVDINSFLTMASTVLEEASQNPTKSINRMG